jgi:hypothetical protein
MERLGAQGWETLRAGWTEVKKEGEK